MNPPCGATVDHSEWTRRRRTSTTAAEGGEGETSEDMHVDHNNNNDKEADKSSRRINRGVGGSNRSPTPSPTPRQLAAPIFTAVVTQHASDKKNPYLLATEPLLFDLSPKVTFCFNHWTSDLCAGHEGVL